jgi:DNA-binding ferritin-like protein
MNNIQQNLIINVCDSQIENSLDSTRNFGIALNKVLTTIKMVHWYTEDYNVHKILGNLYESLSDLFDNLQEEIIGTSKQQNKLFPQINFELDSDNIQNYVPMNGINMETYYKSVQILFSVLESSEFNAYIESVSSGINNVKEEILTIVNKANYLLSMVKL